LVEAFGVALAEVGGALPPVLEAVAHRWRYARPRDGLPELGCLWDDALGIGACGDWLVGPRVEAALRSGAALAGRVLSMR
jgi:predicted NAD/FAD-dependent oxidoreductase